GSFEHCETLHQLARCLLVGGQPAAAEQTLRTARAVIEPLIAAQPDDQSYIRQHGTLLIALADVLTAEGNFPAARAAYEEALKAIRAISDKRTEGVVLGQLGALALEQ